MKAYHVRLLIPFLESEDMLKLSTDERLEVYKEQIQMVFSDIKVFIFENNIKLQVITEPFDKPEFIVLIDDIEKIAKSEFVDSVEEFDLYALSR